MHGLVRFIYFDVSDKSGHKYLEIIHLELKRRAFLFVQGKFPWVVGFTSLVLILPIFGPRFFYLDIIIVDFETRYQKYYFKQVLLCLRSKWGEESVVIVVGTYIGSYDLLLNIDNESPSHGNSTFNIPKIE